MIVLFFDTETTGLPLWKEPSDHPGQPHIVDLACELWDGDACLDTLDMLVNPGVPIPPDMTDIHGITDAMVAADGISKTEMVDRFNDMLIRAEMLAGHNISFDIRMMRIEMARVRGIKWDNPLPTYCTMRKSTNVCKIVGEKARHPEDWKWPKLGEAYEHLTGAPFEDAHRAAPDCAAARKVYFELRKIAA